MILPPRRINPEAAAKMNNILQQLQTEWIHLLNQSVDRIRHCVNQLTADQVWWKPGTDQNSIGVLLRHLAGNLNQWIVDGIPNNENSRDRQAEFDAEMQTSPERLIQELCQVVTKANNVLQGLSAGDLLQQRRIQDFEITALGAIMHSIPHFVGHTHTKSSNSSGCNWGPAINIIGIPTAPETSSRCSESSPRTAFPGLLSRFHSGSWPAVRNCPRDSVIPLQRIGIKAANISADSSVVKNQPHTCRIPFELPWVIRARESVLTLPLHQAMFLRSIVS